MPVRCLAARRGRHNRHSFWTRDKSRQCQRHRFTPEIIILNCNLYGPAGLGPFSFGQQSFVAACAVVLMVAQPASYCFSRRLIPICWDLFSSRHSAVIVSTGTSAPIQERVHPGDHRSRIFITCMPALSRQPRRHPLSSPGPDEGWPGWSPRSRHFWAIRPQTATPLFSPPAPKWPWAKQSSWPPCHWMYVTTLLPLVMSPAKWPPADTCSSSPASSSCTRSILFDFRDRERPAMPGHPKP